MSTHIPYAMFLDSFSPLVSWYNSLIVDDSSLSTVGNDSSEYSVGNNTILSETGDVSVTESSDVSTLDSGSPGDKSVTWSNFVVTMDNDESIEYERMSSEAGTAESLVGVSESKIPVELENGKAWQHSCEPWDCDFYFH